MLGRMGPRTIGMTRQARYGNNARIQYSSANKTYSHAIEATYSAATAPFSLGGTYSGVNPMKVLSISITSMAIRGSLRGLSCGRKKMVAVKSPSSPSGVSTAGHNDFTLISSRSST
jgi:hypothetical protein